MFLVGTAGWGVLAWLSVHRWREGVDASLIWEAGFFLVLALVVGMHPVQLPRGATTTVGFAVDYAALLIFGPAVAGWIGVISETALLWRSVGLRKFFNQGQVVLSFAAAGWMYQLMGGQYVVGSKEVKFGDMAVGLLGCGVAYVVVGSVLISTAMALWERRSVWGMWVLGFRWAMPRSLALAPFGLLMALAYQTPGLGVVAVGLFVVPLAGARYAFQGAMEMLEVHRETVQALSNALEAYDPYTRNHSELVTRYALAVGQELGLPATRLEVLEWACRMHDIGKCRQDWESIIRKPGKPSAREWEVIQRHPVEGSQLAEEMEFLPHTAGEVARIVRAHHERLNGSGYPDGLARESISLEARILGVADAFEAMTARRAYQRRRTPEQAIHELRRCAGLSTVASEQAEEQFDPEVVEALAALWERGELEVEQGMEQDPDMMPIGGLSAGRDPSAETQVEVQT
jgi:putative nucleotidyltransferase with HDIG domain